MEQVDRKAKMQLPQVEVPLRSVEQRLNDFKEVFPGFDEDEAMKEAQRCLLCPGAKCRLACPLGNDIPAAMWLISEGKFVEAADKYRETSIFPEICSRVCPQERLCEGACVYNKSGKPVALGMLEKFVSDYQLQKDGYPMPEETGPPSGKKVAIVGSGPAGLAAAESLVKRGHEVTIYEEKSEAGGLLLYGIPSFKLPKDLVHQKVDYLEKLGVEIRRNTPIGQELTLDDLLAAGNDAVFLGFGAGKEMEVGVPGSDLAGVRFSGEFLAKVYGENVRPEVGGRVVIVGGGDSAMDCLRTARRLGAKDVVCAYRRSEEEMPGSKKERKLAIQEGVRFEYLAAPVRIIGNDRVEGVELQRMELGEPDASGRRSPVPIDGSNFEIGADTVIFACGFRADRDLANVIELENSKGLINADSFGATSRPGIFAAGDCVSGPDLVCTAVAAGLKAAAAIDSYLSRKDLSKAA